MDRHIKHWIENQTMRILVLAESHTSWRLQAETVNWGGWAGLFPEMALSYTFQGPGWLHFNQNKKPSNISVHEWWSHVVAASARIPWKHFLLSVFLSPGLRTGSGALGQGSSSILSSPAAHSALVPGLGTQPKIVSLDQMLLQKAIEYLANS